MALQNFIPDLAYKHINIVSNCEYLKILKFFAFFEKIISYGKKNRTRKFA